jgi:methionine biosynthesis protein MetW
MVPPKTNVLDVGCGAGQLGKYLWDNKGCSISGVDYDEKAIAQATLRCYDIGYALDLNNEDITLTLCGHDFDVVILADVLEHLIDPLKTLEEAVDLVGYDGTIIISVPNIAWLPIRLSMATGHFDYQDYGPLDRTHLRFFTRSSIVKLIEEAGLEITKFDVSVKPSNILMYHLAKLLPGLFAYQMVFKCQRKQESI